MKPGNEQKKQRKRAAPEEAGQRRQGQQQEGIQQQRDNFAQQGNQNGQKKDPWRNDAAKIRRRQAGNREHHSVLIRERIAKDKDFAVEQMLYLQEFQTDSERELKITRFKNTVGFNQPDARQFAKFMDMIKEHGGMRRMQQNIGSEK